ncbi:MAG: thioredoxin [Pelagibacterales bacterium]|nr:thioredoxin [Pelagibacterales bacterium]PPR16611.1 MAG: Thioredoxin-1 [Alphaproteobacteria bacterium MarineAlpha9_Bin3]|tara:strand:- start:3822 stop:4742 length:921 start_codon:yes stop_codon:yes gene_type:complete
MNDNDSIISTEQTMENIIVESDTAAFNKDVIEASKNIPVLVDFWADWCAPCKQLTPIIETLVKSYNGQIKLVKIDTEKNQELSQQLQIQSLPTVYAFYEGQPIDGFSGAMPENEVKKFINKVIEASGGNKLEELKKDIEDAEKLFNEENFEAALTSFSSLLSAEANNATIIAGYGKCLLKLERDNEVAELLEGLEEDMLNDKSILSLIALSKLEKNNKLAGAPEEFLNDVNSNPDNHELRFKLAEAYLASNQKREGLDQLLIIVKKDRKWEEDKARKKILELLNAFGEEDPITSETRLKLSSIIFA